MCIARHSDMQKPGVAGFSVEKNPDKSAHRRREPNHVQTLSTHSISEHKRLRQRQGRNGSGYNAAEKYISLCYSRNVETW